MSTNVAQAARADLIVFDLHRAAICNVEQARRSYGIWSVVRRICTVVLPRHVFGCGMYFGRFRFDVLRVVQAPRI